MADSVQKNFRLKSRAIKLLHDVARAQGMTETDVVEYCVSKYALAIGHDVDRAKELLFEQICRAAANSPVLPSRTDKSSDPALNEEAERGAREATAVEAVTATGQTAAGAIATMVGEQWATKKEKGKKKN